MGSLGEKFSTAGTGTTIHAWIKIVNVKLQPGYPTSGPDARIQLGQLPRWTSPWGCDEKLPPTSRTRIIRKIPSNYPPSSPAPSNNAHNPSKTCSLYGTVHQPPHNLSRNLTNKLRPLTYTNPFPSSSTPSIHTLRPSVLSTQLRHKTTPGIGTGRSYLTVSSAVAHPVDCTKSGVPNVSSRIVAIRPPWAKLSMRLGHSLICIAFLFFSFWE